MSGTKFLLQSARIISATLAAPKQIDDLPMVKLTIECPADGVSLGAIGDVIGRTLRCRMETDQQSMFSEADQAPA